jgi:hypothetical protein
MALAESPVLYNETMETIEFLIDEFDRLFPLLYSVSILPYMYVQVSGNFARKIV